LFLCDRISASVAAEKLVPAASARGVAAGAGAGAGWDAGVSGDVAGFGVGLGAGLGLGLGAGGGAGSGAGAGAAVATAVSALGRSFSAALVSTGASCRSRLRLSAEATSDFSPRPHAARASSVSAASRVLDIISSS
jgi:hypothetical protein